MIWIFIAVVVTLFFAYTFDFKSALVIAKRNPKTFEKVEKNKALVYAVLKDWAEKTNKNVNEMHIINITGWAAVSLLFALIGKFIFGFGFWESALLYLVTQTIAHVMGACTNAYALFVLRKKKEEKENGGRNETETKS